MTSISRRLINHLRQGLMLLKRVLIRKLGLVSDQFFFLDSHMLAQRDVGVERLDVYSPPVETSYEGPFSSQLVKNFFPQRYIYKLDNATIDPLSGFIYDEEGVFIAESSAWYILRNFYSWPKPFIRKPRKKLMGQYIYLHDIGYYHWLIEDLPPFLAALTRYPDATVLSPANPSPWQRALLNSLQETKIFYVDQPLRVENLIMAGKTAGQGNPLFGLTPHPKDIQVLREFFKPYVQEASVESSYLFLSRKDESRCPENIEEVEQFMESQGYKILNTELKLSIFEQAALFSSAKKVVGIHGAALANLVWCEEGTDVIELASQGYLPPAFSMISNIRSLNYSWESYGKVPTDSIEISKLKAFV